MDRFKRIAHRGWLRRFLSVATFGYYPLVDGPVVVYTVQADAEMRFVALIDSAVRILAGGDSAIHIATSVADVEL